MKNKNLIIVSAIVILLLLAGGFFIFSKKDSNTVLKEDSNNKEVSKTVSLAEIIAQNVPQKCTLEYTDGETRIATEMWIKGNKFKQISTNQMPQIGTKEYNMISDGEYIYTWDGTTKKGSKMKIEETQAQDIETSDQNVNLDWETKFDYNCSPSLISDSDLTPPSDIDFVDINSELEKMQDSLENINVDDYIKNLPQTEE